MKELNYVFNNSQLKIPLNLYEAERYEYAVLVHPLVGNLVSYSNKGRYEPLLAKSWSIDSVGNWVFELQDDLHCENGERITPKSFKDSIETSIRFLSKKSDIPVLSKLKGYQDFVSGNTTAISGIEVDVDKLKLTFSQPTRSGVVQILSFAPFGYICKENRNNDGSWKDESRFISSGPYKISMHAPGRKHVLNLRDEWKKANPNSPGKVNFYYSINDIEDEMVPTIVDTYEPLKGNQSHLQKYSLVPEYINPIILSHKSPGKFFASRDNRIVVRNAIFREKEKLDLKDGSHTKTDFFYPNQPPKKIKPLALSKDFQYEPPSTPLIIQGKPPVEGDRKYLNWKVLKPALDALGIRYRFDDSAKNYAERMSEKYDIRFHGSSIGGGAEAWGLAVIFCSEIGPRFPDPSNRICDAINSFESGMLDEQGFTEEFNQSAYDDVSILPVTHYGILMYLSSGIKKSSLSPLISVLRFDQLEIE